MLDKTLSIVAMALGYTVLALMAVLVLGSVLVRRGSLDNLTAADIKEAVDRAST